MKEGFMNYASSLENNRYSDDEILSERSNN